MKITTIRYRRLQSHDQGYGHDALEAEAQIDDGEDAEAALGELKAWVFGRLESMKEIDQHCETLDSLRRRVRDEEHRLKRLEGEVATNRAIIKQHDKLAGLARANGLDAEADALDELPF